MARVRTPHSRGSAEVDAVPLSQQILNAAKDLAGPEDCGALDALASQLHRVAPEHIPGDASRIAFWVNLYNAGVLHALCLRPLRGSLIWHLRMFDRVAYRVGAHDYSLNMIENGVLRLNARAPYRLQRPFRAADPRLAAAPSRVDPRVHFALNCGASSCPPIRGYSDAQLDQQLELATRSYLRAESRLDEDRCRLTLPKLMRLYRTDFGDRAEQLELAARHVPGVGDCLRRLGGKLRLGYAGFDWSVARPPSATAEPFGRQSGPRR